MYIQVVDEVMSEKMAKDATQRKKQKRVIFKKNTIISRIELSAGSSITERTEKTK